VIEVERIYPEHLARPTRAYTPVVRAGDWIYVSGQVPVTSDGSIVVGSTAEQARQVFRNIAAALEAGGGTVSDVVSMTVYLTDVGDIDEIDDVVREVFPDSGYPTRTTLQVAALARKDFRVEI
jgi:2-iminobutanoate/2-iminopropanoate deaminase